MDGGSIPPTRTKEKARLMDVLFHMVRVSDALRRVGESNGGAGTTWSEANVVASRVQRYL